MSTHAIHNIAAGLVIGAVIVVAVVARDGSTPSYPAAVRSSLLAACSRSATPRACKCAMAYVERHVPVTEFLAYRDAVSRGRVTLATLPTWARDADATCFAPRLGS